MAGVDRYAIITCVFAPGDLALKEAGPPCLQVLETAFPQVGPVRHLMLKIIQIIGHIGEQRRHSAALEEGRLSR